MYCTTLVDRDESRVCIGHVTGGTIAVMSPVTNDWENYPTVDIILEHARDIIFGLE